MRDLKSDWCSIKVVALYDSMDVHVLGVGPVDRVPDLEEYYDSCSIWSDLLGKYLGGNQVI